MDTGALRHGLAAAAQYLKSKGLTDQQIEELLRNLRPGGSRG